MIAVNMNDYVLIKLRPAGIGIGMKAPILSPSFRWIAASTHTDPELFRERQRARMEAAQRQREDLPIAISPSSALRVAQDHLYYEWLRRNPTEERK